jgi:S1-C subfamily serine protease
LTNRKSARISPSYVKVQFFDGTIKNGKIIYTDSLMPFGIIKVEGLQKNQNLLRNFTSINSGNFSTEIQSQYSQLNMSRTDSDSNFQPGSYVFLMGTTAEGAYIQKKGKIINTNRNFSSRYGSLFQTSFDRVTQLSGSPVWNENNLVVGMHLLATDTTSYELKIDYVLNILEQINEKKSIKKGDLGISMELVILGIAKMNYKLKNEIADQISKNMNKTGGPPELMLVSSVFPNSPALDKLKSGDIIYKLNNHIIGNDFLVFDKIIDQSVGSKVTFTVSRNGKIHEIEIPSVDNTQNFKIKTYVSFSGAFFHEITKLTNYFLSSDLEGVYLTYTNHGSPFSKISDSGSSNKNNYIITSINSERIKSIEDFINFFKNNCDLESIYIEGRDFNVFPSKISSEAVDLDFSNSLIQIRRLNEETNTWETESLDLLKYCQSNKNLNNQRLASRKDSENLTKVIKDIKKINEANIKLESDDDKLEKFNKSPKATDLEEIKFIEKKISSRKIKKSQSLTELNQKEFLILTNKSKDNKQRENNVPSIKVTHEASSSKKTMFDHLTALHKFRI